VFVGMHCLQLAPHVNCCASWEAVLLLINPTQIPPSMPPKKRKLSEEETTTFYQLIQRFKGELDEEEDKATIESLARISTKLGETRVSPTGSSTNCKWCLTGS
jgi:hypothetical protein